MTAPDTPTEEGRDLMADLKKSLEPTRAALVAARLEEVYSDFLLVMARRHVAADGNLTFGIDPRSADGVIVSVRDPRFCMVNDKRRTTLADALHALLTDLGAHPPERVTEEEVQEWLDEQESWDNAVRALGNLHRAATSDDPRERLMAASILVVGT